MGNGRWKEFAPVEPLGFAANGRFYTEIPVPTGVITRIGFKIRGTTVGSAAVNQDAPERVVDRIRMVFPRMGLRAYELEAPLRYLRLLAEVLNTFTPNRNATGAAADQWSFVDLPLGVLHREAEHFFGIDTSELSGPITIEGTYGAITAYGAGTSAINNFQLVPCLYIEAAPKGPRAALLPVWTRIPFESEIRRSNLKLERANLDGLFALFLFTEDSSAPTADRVQGLITSLRLEHGARGDLFEDEFFAGQQWGMRYFGVPLAQLTSAVPAGLAGVCPIVVNEGLEVTGYPDLLTADLSLTLDAAATVPIGVTNVVPAAGDAVHAIVLGIQGNAEFLERLKQLAA